jgi:hypothetical protein
MLFRETVAVYCENHTEHTDTLCGQNAELFNIVVHMVTIVLEGVKITFPKRIELIFKYGLQSSWKQVVVRLLWNECRVLYATVALH